MKISYNWLKDYLSIDIDADALGRILTETGLEIEGIEEWESVKGGLQGVVIGEVLTCQKHPDADKLSVTAVSTGGQVPLQIVCGAPNVAAGQKVPVATIGTTVFKGNESFEIKKSKIRGVVSEGMICAEDEIGLGTSHEGIMVLDSDAVPGTPAAEYFKIEKDVIFEIGLTPNRIDSGSHFGVARDLAAYLNINTGSDLKAKLPSVDGFRPDSKDNDIDIIVENTAACPRYTGLTISGVTIGESPDWLKKRLRAIGQNPINNVVDITNYVLHEIGQPLHAFDADRIRGRKVIIRNLPENSAFKTLDEVERKLSSKDLMICDTEGGMCIAGVFGGSDSGIRESTRNIFLESACFNPVSIRKTSKRHGLKTDASFRFERGADPNITPWALKRAAMLIKEIAGGRITSEVMDIYPEKISNAVIDISYRNIDRLIGKHIEPGMIKRILGLLEIEVLAEKEGILNVGIPAYRVDVKREADVVEEILRIYGYNNVETNAHVNSTISYTEKPDREKLVNIVSDLLSSNGFSEIMCNSLTPASWYEGKEDFDPDRLVRLSNPLSSDLNAMRQSLLFGGLSSIAWNINRQNPDLKLYEFGNCYRMNAGEGLSVTEKYVENTSLDLFLTGNRSAQSWNSGPAPTDFFFSKSAVEMILTRLGVSADSLMNGESTRKYYSESFTWTRGKKLIAETGRLSMALLKEFDIEQDVYYTHVEWNNLVELIRNNAIRFRELPKYPAVRRDLALLLDTDITFSQIRDLAFRTERNIIREVGLFDVYTGEKIGKDKKSYAVSFILRDDMKTLTDTGIEKIMNNLINVFKKELGAQIR